MGKFSFTGRKKQPPQLTVTAPPMSKAQKILGSTVINVDDEFSSSKTSLTLPDRSGIPSRTRSLRASPRAAPEWGDESDIIPRRFREEGGSEAYSEYDDMTSSAQKRQSSTSLSEWYDKTKQPLAISQQTSNSAMAKGLPSKAHRMLDMDHTQSNVKSRTKPSRLDLTHIMSRKSKKNERPAWEGPVLGAEHLTRSPSILSPLTPPGLRGKLKKRPTKESLQSVQSGPRTGGSDSSRRGNHLDGLPNLYEHYEQMSFRHVMEEDLNAMEDDESVHEPILEEVPEESYEEALDGYVDEEMERVEEDEEEEEHYEEEERQTHLEPLPPKMYNVPVSKSAQNLPLPHHAEHIISQYARRTLPQTPQAATIPKADMSSPTDCAASISSRHTRTSKASKRTDQSLHESDLQEKSMLMLSSDSEDESYDPSFKGPASVPDYPVSDSGSVFDQRPTTARTSQSADNKRASRASRVTNTSNTTKFLAIPSGHPSAGATRFSSLSGSSNNTVQEVSTTLARSPSAASCMTNSSVNTTMTWQSKIGLGLHQARAVTAHSARGSDVHDVESVYSQDQDEVVYEPIYEPVYEPVYEDEQENEQEYEREYEQEKEYEHEHEHEHEHEADDEFETSHIQASTIRDSVVSGGDQPTPPLSPSSVDFYIDGNAAHGRFMAVTRQEEMLLSALRHKRQIMRETILNEMEDNARADGRMPRGHMSKPSEATIAESHFELDFPAPPMCKNKTTVTADGTTIIDLRRGSSVSQFHASVGTGEDIPDVPALPSDQALRGQREIRNNQHERILLYLDHPLHDHDGPIEESEPSPDLSDFMEFDAEESESGDGLSEVVLYPTQMHRRGASRSSSRGRSGMVKPLQLKSNSERTIEYGIPRPDSPISPDPMTSKPRRGTINSKTARLSAVGPARWGYED